MIYMRHWRRDPERRPSARGSLGGPRARGSATGGPPAVRGSGPRPRGQPLPARGSGDWRREPEWRSGSALHPPRPQRPPDRRGEEKKKKKKMFYKIKMNGLKMKLSYFTDKTFLTTLVSCDLLFVLVYNITNQRLHCPCCLIPGLNFTRAERKGLSSPVSCSRLLFCLQAQHGSKTYIGLLWWAKIKK